MLTEYADTKIINSYQKIEAYPSPADLAQVEEMLSKSKAPLMIVGGGGWDEASCQKIQDFAEKNHLPVGCSFRCQDYFDNRHPNYVGHIGIGLSTSLQDRIINSDLLLVIGARLGEVTTSGYSLLDIPRPKQQLIHIHSGLSLIHI